MASRRCAEWRFPTEKQQRAEATARQITETAAPLADPAIGPADPMSDAHWNSVLRDPRGRVQTGVPIQQRRLSEIPRHVLRVECRKCDRIVEIQTADAIRLYGAHTTWKDAGRRLLDNSCQNRTGSHEDDGCWPSFE